MLVMTPQAKAMLRKERRRERDAMRGKLGEARHRALVDKLSVRQARWRRRALNLTQNLTGILLRQRRTH